MFKFQIEYRVSDDMYESPSHLTSISYFSTFEECVERFHDFLDDNEVDNEFNFDNPASWANSPYGFSTFVNNFYISFGEIKVEKNKLLKNFYGSGVNKNLFEIFPIDFIELENYISDNFRDLDCVDNFRIALKGDELAEKEYEKRVKEGCCGFYDKEVMIGEKTYLIGCNYGH